MGSVKIHSKDMSIFFNNEIGDVNTVVKIYTKPVKRMVGKFIEHFTVKTPKTVYLSDYDCDDFKIYCFPAGRWFVYVEKQAVLNIYFVDMDIDS
jgi:hypothetical protein